MNWLDKSISWFAPSVGLKRARARALTEAVRLSYEGARIGRRTAGWISDGKSANAEIGADLTRLRERSRELIRNNHYAAKAAMQFQTRIVGTGITTQWQDQRAQLLWDKWSQQCSADGLANFAAVQALVARTIFESGEAIVRLRVRRAEDKLPVAFQVQVLESDFLDLSKTEQTKTGYIIQGVEFDLVGRRIAYWLYQQHPGEVVTTTTKQALQSVRVPRYDDATDIEQVLHIYEATRPGQVRGVPHLAPVMLKMRDLDDWETAELVRKKTEACFVGSVTQIEGTGDTLNPTVTDASGNKIESVNPGQMVYGSAGAEVKFFSPAHAGGYEEYKRCAARDIAVGLFTPYEIQTGDFSQTNYSNYRGGLIGYRDRVEALQWNLFIPLVCEPIANAFLMMAWVENKLPAAAEYPHEWAPPAFDLLDREAEAKADELEGRIGTKTWPQLVARQGYDPEKQIAEITAWKPRLEAAGVTFNEKAVQNAGNDQTQTPKN